MTASLLPSPKCDFWTFWPTSSKLKWKGMKVFETIKLPEYHEQELTDLKKHLHSFICWGRDRPLPAAIHPLWQHWDNPSHHTYSPIIKSCLTPAKAFWPSRGKGLLCSPEQQKEKELLLIHRGCSGDKGHIPRGNLGSFICLNTR